MNHPDAEHALPPYSHIMTHRDHNKTHGAGHTDNPRADTNAFDINVHKKDNVNHINRAVTSPRAPQNKSPSVPLCNNNNTIAPRATHVTSHFLHADSNVNLSTLFSPTAEQLTLLEKGLSFIPTPNKHNYATLRRDVHSYHRRIKIADYFSTITYTHIPFTFPSDRKSVV